MSQLEINQQLPFRDIEHPNEEEKAPTPFPKKESKQSKKTLPNAFDLAEALLKKNKRFQESGEGASLPIFSLHAAPLPSESAQVMGNLELDAQIALLSEKILDGFQVIQDKGILKTRLILNPPNPLSIFNGTEIELTQHDTAPLSLNIEFFGTEAANLLLVSSIAAFEKSLKENLKETKIGRIDFSLRTKPNSNKKVTEIDECQT